MTAFTRLGAAIWDWEPWTDLDALSRILWLALYTSAEAKRHVPGLWQGGIPAMADAARLSPDDVVSALDRLLDRNMVEYDPKYRVLRLVELPDAGEYPSNGKVIRGWWTKFSTVPVCPVRDAHVQTIDWILATGSRLAGKAVSDDHKNAWSETFAKVQIPAPRRRGIRRLADSDTSTQIQPSLFCPSGQPSGNGIATPVDASYAQGSHAPVDNSATLRHLNDLKNSGTVSDTVSDTYRIPDPGSRIPESLSLLPERGLGGGHGSGRPMLTLVSSTYTAADVFAALAAGRWDPGSNGTHHEAVTALIPRWVSNGVRLEDLKRLAEYSTFQAAADLKFSARYLAGCDIRQEIDRANKALDWRDARVAASLRESSS